MSRAGYDVTLVATGEGPTSPPFPVVGMTRSPRRITRMLTGSGRAVLHAIRLRPAIVHLHDPELIPWVPVLRCAADPGRVRLARGHRRHHAPQALSRHDSARTVGRGAGPRSSCASCDRTASGIVAATPNIAEAYRQPRTGASSRTSPSSTTGRRPPAIRGRGNRLVYVGGLTEERGVMADDGRAQPAARIPRRDPGPGRSDPRVTAPPRSRSTPPGRTSTIADVVTRSGVAALLSESTLGVVLFQPLPNHVNSQPTKMFEYMAAGPPGPGQRLPALAPAGRVMPGSVSQLPRRMPTPSRLRRRTILDDPARGRRMGLQGRQIVEQERNWQHEGEALVDFYQRLLRA